MTPKLRPLLRPLLAALFVLCGSPHPPAAADVTVPNHWDPRRRTERPPATALPVPVRILTAHDHPPFNYVDGRGEPTGFNVELARAICRELGATCTIQARDFDLLLPALREPRGPEVVMAALRVTADLRRDFEVGDIYLRSPARFAVRIGSPLTTFEPEMLAGRRIGALAGTAHAAFVETFFAQARLVRFDDAETAREALRRGEIDALFGDATQLAFWINGTGSQGCCTLRGGAFTETRFFGDGFAAVFRPGGEALRRAFDHALHRLHERGDYAELYLRWFPVGLY